MTVTAYFTGIGGEGTTLYSCTGFEVVRPFASPVYSCKASFAVSGPLPEQKTVRLLLDGETLFDGLMDKQCYSEEGDGRLLKIEARTRGACLLDCEAKPQTYYNPSIERIFERHIEPYGFTRLSDSFETRPSEFVVRKGMSEWDVLKNYCRASWRPDPYIDRGGVVRTEYVPERGLPVEGGRIRGVHLAFGQEIDRTQYVSETGILDELGRLVYSREYTPELGITRRRYLYSAGVEDESKWWQSQYNAYKRAAATRLVRREVLAHYRAIYPGDFYEPYDSEIGWAVWEVRYILNEDGFREEVELRDHRFIR